MNHLKRARLLQILADNGIYIRHNTNGTYYIVTARSAYYCNYTDYEKAIREALQYL